MRMPAAAGLQIKREHLLADNCFSVCEKEAIGNGLAIANPGNNENTGKEKGNSYFLLILEIFTIIIHRNYNRNQGGKAKYGSSHWQGCLIGNHTENDRQTAHDANGGNDPFIVFPVMPELLGCPAIGRLFSVFCPHFS